MKKIDLSAVPAQTGSNYPHPFDAPCSRQSCQRLARHWHSHEEEFVWVVDGELTLVTDTGEEILRAGDCAAFRRGDPEGHHLINRSGRPAKVLEIGNSDPQDRCTYPDIDMIADARGYTHRDGTPYPLKK